MCSRVLAYHENLFKPLYQRIRSHRFDSSSRRRAICLIHVEGEGKALKLTCTTLAIVYQGLGSRQNYKLKSVGACRCAVIAIVRPCSHDSQRTPGHSAANAYVFCSCRGPRPLLHTS